MNCLVILMNRTFPLEYFCEKHHNSMLFLSFHNIVSDYISSSNGSIVGKRVAKDE